MSHYAAAYLGTTPIVRLPLGTPDYVWVRPTDWPSMPALGTSDNKFVGVYGVDSTDGNYVSLLTAVSSGTWSVDWGDGTVETGLTSNVKRDHIYNYSTISGTPTADGFKAVTVTVTTSGGAITTFSLQQKHSQSGLPGGAFRVNWLDISINAPSLTTLALGGTTVTLDKIQRATIGIHAVTNMSSLFNGCYSLQSVPYFNTAAVTNMTSMFQNCAVMRIFPLLTTSACTTMGALFSGCSSMISPPMMLTGSVTNFGSMFSFCFALQSVPLYNTAAGTSFSSMFQNCYSLLTVPLFNLASATSIASMLQSCSSLITIPLFTTATVTTANNFLLNAYALTSVPLLNTAAVTNASQMFYGCQSLPAVPFFNFASVTNASGLFYGCNVLKSIPLFNFAAVTNASTMFYSCTNLKTIPLLNFAAVTNALNLFAFCNSLQSIPQLVLSAVSSAANAATMFNSCYSLSVGRTSGLTYSHSYSGCKLSAAQIDAVFTGLGTSAGAQTITVSGNFGYATCTPSIAMTKGWVVA